MAFKNKQDAQAAYDAAARESNAYQHALVASMKGELKRVGSVKDGGDTYIWQIAFTPRYFSAVIVQTFKSKVNRDDSIRVFWLMDWKRPTMDNFLWDELYSKAQAMERRKVAIDHPPTPASDVGGLIADVQEEFECSYERALVLSNCD
jgi:hypothetical protein